MVTELRLPLFPEVQTDSEQVGRKEHLTFKANRGSSRHGWLRLTPAYSLRLVEDLVSVHSVKDIVLDPFCGTGTTALVCAQAGIHCDTVDINPFLVWLTNAKCAGYGEADVHQAEETLLFALSQPVKSAWIPGIRDIEKWWDAETLGVLSSMFAVINGASISDSSRNLLYVTFCKVLIRVAAVSFGHQSMSFRKEEKPKGLFHTTKCDELSSLFRKAFAEVAISARELVPDGLGRAFQGDSRDFCSVPGLGKYTVVITSPPYPNRISYIRELRPYMYWLGHLSSGRQAGELDWEAIGGTWGCATSNLTHWTPDPNIQVPFEGFLEVVNSISAHSDVLGKYVHKYFQDMVLHVQSLRSVLVDGAYIYYLVGNSKFYDVVLEVEEIYAAIFRHNGFGQVEVERLRKRSSKKELYEFLVKARAQRE